MSASILLYKCQKIMTTEVIQIIFKKIVDITKNM
jgi:hypothetical protein